MKSVFRNLAMAVLLLQGMLVTACTGGKKTPLSENREQRIENKSQTSNLKSQIEIGASGSPVSLTMVFVGDVMMGTNVPGVRSLRTATALSGRRILPLPIWRAPVMTVTTASSAR